MLGEIKKTGAKNEEMDNSRGPVWSVDFFPRCEWRNPDPLNAAEVREPRIVKLTSGRQNFRINNHTLCRIGHQKK